MTGPPLPDDPIELLRDQVRAATEAAERLVREASAAGPDDTRRAAGSATATGADDTRRAARGSATAGEIPDSGWDAPSSRPDAGRELQALGRLFETVRELLPEDLQRQVTELIRQLLLVLRALIDWAVTRIESSPRGRDVRVEDIPIA